MSNIIQSKFNLREQETTWYGASHHHEDLEELSEKPTLTENYKLVKSRIFLNTITILDNGQKKKRSITKIVESTSIKYNLFTGDQVGKETEHFIYNCNNESKIQITSELFYKYLSAINIMLKNWQVENPVYKKMIKDTQTWCRCQKTYWNEDIGYGAKGCWTPEGMLGELDYYDQDTTQAQKDAITSAMMQCGGSTIESAESTIQSGGVLVHPGVNQWGDYNERKGCNGCVPPEQYLIDYKSLDYIKSVVRPMDFNADSWDAEITTKQEAEAFLLDFDNTYCFPPNHHWEADNDWVTPDSYDPETYYDPESSDTNPHNLVESGCLCLNWECPPESSLQEVVSKSQESTIMHSDGATIDLSGDYTLSYFGGLVINDYEKSVCVDEPTFQPKHEYYIKNFKNNDPRYEAHFLDRVGCKPVLVGGNLANYQSDDPVSHSSGHSYTWCADEPKSYTDPGLNDNLTDCASEPLELGYDVKTLYFSGSNYSQNFLNNKSALLQNLPITNETEIAKLGLDEVITCDDGTKLNETSDSDTLYTFSVAYLVTDIHGNQAITGRTITVAKNCTTGSGSG